MAASPETDTLTTEKPFHLLLSQLLRRPSSAFGYHHHHHHHLHLQNMALSSSSSICFEEYKPLLAMVVVQFIYAGMALSAKAAFNEGLSPFVFVVYRQAIATLILAPCTILAKGGSLRSLALDMRAFGLVFVASLVGATLNQSFYYQGIKLASSSMGTAMTNLIPAITFAMAAAIGLEKVKVRNLRSMAKVIGTIICVGGASCMAFFKGPKLLNMEHGGLHDMFLVLTSSSDNWLLGSIFLIGSACCWSFWLILQVPICKHYLDALSLSTWMCLLSTIQSAFVTFLLEPDLVRWKITSSVELLSCLFAGIFGSGVTFYLQSWSISVRGPLFSAMFNPLSTVITTTFAAILLHERLYTGSLIGAIAVVSGLYIVLWGKSKDYSPATKPDHTRDSSEEIVITVNEKQSESETDLTKPLIAEKVEDTESI